MVVGYVEPFLECSEQMKGGQFKYTFIQCGEDKVTRMFQRCCF